jgi:type I restriction-modification system DNA methylase subunit
LGLRLPSLTLLAALPTLRGMAGSTTFEFFQAEIKRLVETFGKNLDAYKSAGYDEASLRQEFLNPLFRALGWDMENKAGLIPAHREVVAESRTDVGRADYLFRTDRKPRFVCEAKRPVEELQSHAQQAKGYAWTIGVPLAVLTDFEGLNIYIVGSEPKENEPLVGLWKTHSFREYPAKARELWDLLARDNVAGGSIDRAIESLPKKPLRLGKGQFVVRPDPTQSFDAKFLNFLDSARRSLASDLLKHNDRADLLEGTRLNDAVQCILDRLLFIRISEARGIDMGTKLHSLLETWQRRHEREGMVREPPAHWGGAGLNAPRGSLWHSIVRHIRALDRRPPSHVPYFNGNLFKLHFSEELVVGDEWLEGFLEAICNEYSSYKFGYVAVEILGTIYERFLGKIVRAHGRGAVIEEKPEVRKAGGVYYTPRYIVEYIVEQTVGKMLEGKKPEETLKLRFLDPACGSGSFLLRVFERVCEHWQQWLTDHPDKRKKDWCWLDAKTNTLHLTARTKRRILRETVYGVDIDPQAVEVTQLSLYLKMLEGETSETLQREQDLFGGDEPILPPLHDNIKQGNSLIASDFSMIPDDLVRVRAFDWNAGFKDIMKAGGFDAVVGNPPYIRIQTMQESDAESVAYLNQRYAVAKKGNYDIYVCFVERGLGLLNKNGTLGFILPHKFTNSEYGQPLRNSISTGRNLAELVHFGANQVFEGATTYTCLMFLKREKQNTFRFVRVDDLKNWAATNVATDASVKAEKVTAGSWSFSVGRGAELVDRLRAYSPRLGDAADIFVGLQTSADDVFVLEFVARRGTSLVVKSKVLGEEVELERDFLRPLVSGTDVQGYDSFDGRQFILFPYSVADEKAALVPFAELKRRAPKTAKYLEANRKRLEDRERGKFADSEWYRFGRNQNLGIQERKKVCVPRLVDCLCAAIDAKGENYLDNVDVGGVTFKTGFERHDLRYLTGLLNCKLLAWFFPNVSAPFRGGWMSANRQFLSQLPFRAIDVSKPADKARHDKLVGLVDKMLVLMPKLRQAGSESERQTLQNAVTAAEQQIDALVYELYGLTEDEIRLVEAS